MRGNGIYVLLIAGLALVFGIEPAVMIAKPGGEEPDLGKYPIDVPGTVQVVTWQLEKAAESPAQPGMIGYGLTFGPRENRVSVVIWNDCGAYTLEYEIHGEPTSPLQSVGPVLADGEVEYTRIIGKLREQDQCPAVTP